MICAQRGTIFYFQKNVYPTCRPEMANARPSTRTSARLPGFQMDTRPDLQTSRSSLIHQCSFILQVAQQEQAGQSKIQESEGKRQCRIIWHTIPILINKMNTSCDYYIGRKVFILIFWATQSKFTKGKSLNFCGAIYCLYNFIVLINVNLT